ncbi:uncharacterized protein LOC115980739 [Quercus lobata]|uniref:uncharacterized protein LOC115980739 n=1 Tax=Quercus lobata TaxID=97700 RepID=UPI001244A8D3|nr:uncharacterized protein LOC115980739 [Quercus lobata]
MDAMNRALRRAAQSPFSNEIEQALMLSRFTWPPFNSYDEKMDPVEHVSHYIHMMSLNAHNDVLMCKEFDAKFVTYSRVPQPVDALLSIKMRVGETLRSYASRYWELYNEIGRGNEKIVANTFKMGLPEGSELRELLTKKPPEDMRQLMRHIKEYKRLENDQLQNKKKAPLLGRSRQGIIPTRPKKDFRM